MATGKNVDDTPRSTLSSSLYVQWRTRRGRRRNAWPAPRRMPPRLAKHHRLRSMRRRRVRDGHCYRGESLWLLPELRRDSGYRAARDMDRPLNKHVDALAYLLAESACLAENCCVLRDDLATLLSAPFDSEGFVTYRHKLRAHRGLLANHVLALRWTVHSPPACIVAASPRSVPNVQPRSLVRRPWGSQTRQISRFDWTTAHLEIRHQRNKDHAAPG
jgi:hypothetical protein